MYYTWFSSQKCGWDKFRIFADGLKFGYNTGLTVLEVAKMFILHNNNAVTFVNE